MDARDEGTRPDIYQYHDHRDFLRDWFHYLKRTRPRFSLRSLAKDAQLASGYLPMVLAGSRKLSEKALAKLAPHLGLNANERTYLDQLRLLGDADSEEVRRTAFENLQKHRSYQASNPREMEVYRYLTSWYYVAIRELALLPGFRADAKWIQGRLKGRVGLKEVQAALDFLTEHGFLKPTPEGGATVEKKDIQCIGGVYRLALNNFHREMLRMALESLSETSRDKRTVEGFTLPISGKNFPKVVKLLQGVFEEIAKLEDTSDAKNEVYHVALCAFPLTK